MDVTVRLATAADEAAIREIYNYYVENSTCTFQMDPMSEAEHLAWLTDRSEKHPVTVAESEGVVIGWASLSPWKSRCAYESSCEASVYVRHDAQQRGIGSALTADMIERARKAGMRTIIGGACTEHPGSLALQAKFGFEPVGTFKEVGRKFDRWLDVAYTQLVL